MKSFWHFLAASFLGAAMLLPRVEAATSPPLPPLDAVLQHVMQTSAEENAGYHQFNQHYFYTRDKVTEYLDSAGKVKQREEKQSTNSPSPVVALPKPQPQPVPKVNRSGRRGSAAEQPAVHGVPLGQKEDLLNPDIVKRFKFTLAGREIVHGRSALIIDFKPASNDLPVFNIKDRFINSIAGRAWVDEGDWTLEKVDLGLTQKVSVLGGVVGAVSKFNFSFVRERTADGYWFTRDLSWHLEGREAAFSRVVSHREEVSDLKKMQ